MRLRRGKYDEQWLLDEQGDVLGIYLGWDECIAHDVGVAGIGHALGVNATTRPLGVIDLKVTKVPENLLLQKFTYYAHDKGHAGQPAGALQLHPDLGEAWIASFRDPATTRQALVDCGDFHLWGNPTDASFKEHRDIACCWDPDAFGVVVRGEANIKRLEELFAAFQRCDIALGGPWEKMRLIGGLCFMVLSRISAETRDSVLAADMAARAGKAA